MQKRKSFLMKLLVLLTVVFCTFALAFGMVGCAADGKDGANGKDGKDGISIQSAIVDANGDLIITLTDGNTINAGKVKGEEGPQGGTLDTNCEHVENEDLFVLHEVRPATCEFEQVMLKICTECNGYEVVVGEKDTNNHVKYEWKQNDIGLYVLVVDNSKDDLGNYREDGHILVHPQTEFEAAMGACSEKTCTLCNTELEAHENIEERPVSSDAVICEEEHLVAEFCLDCKAYVSTITKRAPIGHKYKNSRTDYEGFTTSANTFNVDLVCEECGDTKTVVATKDSTKCVETTCKVAGYDIYTYSYEYSNGTAPETKTADIKINVADAPSNEHTIVAKDGKTTLKVDYVDENTLETIQYVGENGKALKVMFADGTVRIINGQLATCVGAPVMAVADCAICSEGQEIAVPITFNVTGEHNCPEDKKVAATCVVDEYIPCQVTGCTYKHYTGVLAEGHDYKVLVDTFVATDDADLTKGGTVAVECKVCAAKVTSVPVTFVSHNDGNTCQDATSDTFKTKDLSNGIKGQLNVEDTNHAKYVSDVAIEFTVIDEDAVIYHVLGAGTDYEMKFYQGQDKVAYNDKIDKAVKAGALRAIGLDELHCNQYKDAVYSCSHCTNDYGYATPITIKVSGPHKTSGDLLTKNATCTQFGYTYRECENADCGIEAIESAGLEYVGAKHVVETYIEPVGHNFVVDTDALEIFDFDAAVVKTDSTEGSKLTYKCAVDGCTATTQAELIAKGAVIPGDPNSCNPSDKTPYTFKISQYVIKSSDVTVDATAGTVTVGSTLVTDEDTQYDSEAKESHKLVVNGKTITGIENGMTIEKDDENILIWREGFTTGDVRWVNNDKGTCRNERLAIFDCARCKDANGHAVPITVYLYNECEVLEGSYEPATCTKGGFDLCKVCGSEIPRADDPAKGHDYEWKLTDDTVVTYDPITKEFSFAYGTVTGTCKNDKNHVVTATADAIDADDITANCCVGQTIQVSYRYDGQVRYTEDVKIDATGDHVLRDDTLQPPVEKGAVYVDFAAKVVYAFQWCFEGERYVLVDKIDIADGACASTSHSLLEIYNDGEVKVVLCQNEGKAFIVEIEK